MFLKMNCGAIAPSLDVDLRQGVAVLMFPRRVWGPELLKAYNKICVDLIIDADDDVEVLDDFCYRFL